MRLPYLVDLLEAPAQTRPKSAPEPRTAPGVPPPDPGMRTPPSKVVGAPGQFPPESVVEKLMSHYWRVLRDRGVDIQHTRHIGKGAMGHAYDIGEDKVLKITVDADEATAAEHIKKHDFLNVYKVYDVFQFDHLGYYGILQDKYDHKLKDNMKLYNFHGGSTTGDAYDLIFKPLSNNEITREEAEKAVEEFAKGDKDLIHYGLGLVNGVEELKKAGVTDADTHTGNVMLMSDRKTPVIIDPGISSSPPVHIDRV